jgi:hypothetical protein
VGSWQLAVGTRGNEEEEKKVAALAEGSRRGIFGVKSKKFAIFLEYGIIFLCLDFN